MASQLAMIPDALLMRERSTLSDGARAAELVAWLAERHLRPTLLDIERERARRRAQPEAAQPRRRERRRVQAAAGAHHVRPARDPVSLRADR